VDPHGTAAARALHGQPVPQDRLDVLGPDVNRPHLVARVAEDAGVHRPHRTGADDRDLHVEARRIGPRVRGAAPTHCTGIEELGYDPLWRVKQRAAPARGK
jgi:hypothetical protein